jgi:hypothetical protein
MIHAEGPTWVLRNPTPSQRNSAEVVNAGRFSRNGILFLQDDNPSLLKEGGAAAALRICNSHSLTAIVKAPETHFR